MSEVEPVSESNMNFGTRPVSDDRIKCPGGVVDHETHPEHTVAECLASDLGCPCRELHERIAGMEHVIGLMQQRIAAAEKERDEARKGKKK